MKWAAAILGVILYLVWPYCTLIGLAYALQSGDARDINQMVDWGRLRSSLKAQLQADLENIPKSAGERENPALAAFGNAFALRLAKSLIDKMVTPEGLTALIQGARAAAATPKTSQQMKAAATTSATAGPLRNFSQRVKFAFFVSPIHFQIDLRGPGPESDHTSTLTVMMIFKGTGWQIYDVRLPKDDKSLKLATATK